MLVSIIILAVLGFVISAYTYATERKLKQVPGYKPFCDISDRISCTKPMKSQYAYLYFSLASIGMAFYVAVAIFALFDATKLLLLASFAAALVSCALAYILYVKIKSLCILCTSLYVINFLLLFFSLSAR